MSRVNGRAPRPAPEPPTDDPARGDAGDGPADDAGRSRARRTVDTAVGVAASAAVGVFSAHRSDASLWWAVLFVAVVAVVWVAWRWASVRVGRLTAAAAVCSAGFALSAALYVAAPNCPLGTSPGRCEPAEVAQGGLLGLVSVAALLLGSFAAVTVWAATLRVLRAVPGAGRAVGAAAGRIEAGHRARRDRGVRWVLDDWRRDPVVWSAAVGTVLGAATGALLGTGAGDVAMWSAGGLLALGAVPAAWRAGGAARSPRRQRRR